MGDHQGVLSVVHVALESNKLWYVRLLQGRLKCLIERLVLSE